MSTSSFSIVTTVNERNVLRNNLLRSPDLANGHAHELLVQEGYQSAALAYNAALECVTDDIVVFVHQDIYLPEGWFSDLGRAIDALAEIEWGVLGCAGVHTATGEHRGQVFTNGIGVHGRRLDVPLSVDSLDEIVLVVRRSSGLRFDPLLPHFHLYGTDICLTARRLGYANFAFQGFCVHNTTHSLILPPEYYNSYDYVRTKWWHVLPVRTTCLDLTRSKSGIYIRALRDVKHRLLGHARRVTRRVDDPRVLWERI